jgi:hypothetical protein
MGTENEKFPRFDKSFSNAVLYESEIRKTTPITVQSEPKIKFAKSLYLEHLQVMCFNFV